MAAPTMTVCEEDVMLAVIFREDSSGRIDAHVKGNMDPRELVYQLREIANHVEMNGPVDG